MAPNMFKHLGLPYTWKSILGDDACDLSRTPDESAWFVSNVPETTGGAGLRANDEYTTSISVDVSKLMPTGGTMIDEQLTVDRIDNHYHIKIGCQETIVHDKKEALKWLGKLWDEHIKEE